MKHQRSPYLGWLVVLMMLACHTLTASEPHPPAPVPAPTPQPGDAAPGRSPVPRLEPAVPTPDTREKTMDEVLLMNLEARLRDVDALITTRVRSGARQAPVTFVDPRLERPRRERDQAAQDLADALATSGPAAASHDVLDGANPRRHGHQTPAITASNRLMIAECLRELISAAPASADEATLLTVRQDLRSGFEALDGIDNAALTASELIRSAYILVWFRAEDARLAHRGKDSDYPQKKAAALAAQAAFLANHGGSDLATGAGALLAGLP